ncbi:MAG: class I SAM-dependent methyltransferase [Sedimentisphaerales bacterium]|nr:class I SAM-dependent methyltransferase [Sedimentisphaerales bacterium]
MRPELAQWNKNYFSQHKDRYKFDLELIQRFFHNGTILEVGSLPCHMTYCLKKLGYPAVSIDLDPERAHNFINKNELQVVKCDIEKEKIPYNDNAFRLILFNEVFEHLRIDPICTLEELYRVLDSEGYLILSTPNLCSLPKRLMFVRGQGFDNPYESFRKLHTLGHVGHVREYTAGQVKEFMHQCGFQCVKLIYKRYHKTEKGFWGNIQDWLMDIRPKWRPFQILIFRKPQ